MKKLFIISLLILSSCSPAWCQTQVTQDTLPNTNSSDSTAVLNNNLRMAQNAINSIGGYFNSNGYLGPANGGTGTNISAFPNGSLLVYNSSNVGIGTFNEGTSGQILTSQGAGVNPIFSTPTHGTQIFTSSGSFTAPAGVSIVFFTECAGGGGGGGGAGGASTGGGGAGGCLTNYAYQVTPLSIYTATIGAGGNGGNASGGVGQDGGDTTFDLITVAHGTGGIGSTGGGAAGTGGSHSLSKDASGTTHGSALAFCSGGNGSSALNSGTGGASCLGSGGSGGTGNGANGSGFGSGGGGGGNGTGGAGQQGILILQY